MGVKGAEATNIKILAKSTNAIFFFFFFFYSNLYLHFLRPCCKDIVKFVYIVSEKIGK